MSKNDQGSRALAGIIAIAAIATGYTMLNKPERFLGLPGVYPGELVYSGYISIGVGCVIILSLLTFGRR